LVRYGRYVRLTVPRIKVGQYRFLKHGGKVVFFGRFVAVLRASAAFLAGTMQMHWLRFLLYNAAGGIVWTFFYGFSSYILGQQIRRLLGPVGVVISVASIILVAGWLFFLYWNEEALKAEAERALPGPLKAGKAR
jgi:membrane protein DedA with SNARE-associated domain